jgi:hypothetical protein
LLSKYGNFSFLFFSPSKYDQFVGFPFANFFFCHQNFAPDKLKNKKKSFLKPNFCYNGLEAWQAEMFSFLQNFKQMLKKRGIF